MKKHVMRYICFSVVAALILAPSAFAQEVGVAWVGKSGMAKRVLSGLEEKIKESAPDIVLEVKPELGSLDDLKAQVDKWATSKKALVILRSNGAKWLGANKQSLPCFIGGCSHPGELGVVKNMEAPEGNITGVTYYLPIKSQFDVFQAMIPGMKSVFLLLEKGHPAAAIDRAETQAVCNDLGIQYSEFEATAKEEAEKAVKEKAGKVSVIIIGNQALNIDNAANLVAAAGKTPVLSYSAAPVKAGALGGFVADDVKLGRMLGESIIDVLKNGKPIKEVPVKVDPAPKFFVNAKTAENIGIEIPFDILNMATVIE